MYHRVRRKMRFVVCAILILVPNASALPTLEDTAPDTTESIDNYENNVIDFDEEYSVKYSNKYDVVPWRSPSDKYVKDSHRYTIVKEDKNKTNVSENKTEVLPKPNLSVIYEATTETDYSVIPLELVSTTENYLSSIIESTTDQDLSVIPLPTTPRNVPIIEINQTVTLPTSTQESETTTDVSVESIETTTEKLNDTTIKVQTTGESELSTDKTISKSNLDVTTSTSLNIVKLSNLDVTTSRIDLNNRTEISNIYLETTTINVTTDKVDNSRELSTIRKDTTNKMNTSVHIILPEQITNTTKRLNTKETEVETTTSESKLNNVTTLNEEEQLLIINSSKASTTEKEASTTEKINNTHKEIRTAKIRKVMNLNETNGTTIDEVLTTNSSKKNENITLFDIESIEIDDKDVPVFTELDPDEEEVPEDYYDAKDVVATTTPKTKTNALSVLVGLAGSVVESVVESVAERVVPKGIFDLFKRMQRQSEALESERLRSREENGGLGQFGRGILKTISSGLSKPLSQLMAGAKDIGSLDNDRGFVASLASGVTSVATVATSLADAFKDRVQAIYPGTVWCGDGHSATARSGELGLFFFTDTCCRQHDACKIYIRAGETKYGLTNTGLFTRSHCSCDAKFRECLKRTNSLVSAQIGLTYFNVLGPQCFRRAHPILKCMKRTRITGQKCEEYEFDYTKPKMWQWFDNETF